MSHDTIGAKGVSTRRGSPDTQGPQLAPREVAVALYRFMHNKRTGLFLILAMAVLTLVGVLFQQAPAEVRTDPESYSSWLESVRPRYRGWTTPLDVLGVFHIFSSLAFKAVTILLALSIIACTSHRLPLLWKQATKPHAHVTSGFFSHSRLHTAVTVAGDADSALGLARAQLRRRRYRIVDDPQDGETGFYADRFRWAPFGTVIAHVAFVIILLGVLVSSGTGFRDNQFAVGVGSTRPVGHGTDLAVRVDGFQDNYDATGRPIDYVADVVLFKDGEQVKAQQVRVNQPLRYDGVKFNQSYFGTAADLTITDASGTLFRSGVPMEWTTQDELNTYGKFEIPGKNLQVYVVGVASGQTDPEIAPGQIRVEVYPVDSNDPLATQVLTQGVPMTIQGLTYTFEREAKFTGLMVSRDPGAAWVWTGAGLIVLGTCMTMFFRHHRIWVRAVPATDANLDDDLDTDSASGVSTQNTTLLLASPDKQDTAFESHFFRLAHSIESGDAVPSRKA